MIQKPKHWASHYGEVFKDAGIAEAYADSILSFQVAASIVWGLPLQPG